MRTLSTAALMDVADTLAGLADLLAGARASGPCARVATGPPKE